MFVASLNPCSSQIVIVIDHSLRLRSSQAHSSSAACVPGLRCRQSRLCSCGGLLDAGCYTCMNGRTFASDRCRRDARTAQSSCPRTIGNASNPNPNSNPVRLNPKFYSVASHVDQTNMFPEDTTGRSLNIVFHLRQGILNTSDCVVLAQV